MIYTYILTRDKCLIKGNNMLNLVFVTQHCDVCVPYTNYSTYQTKTSMFSIKFPLVVLSPICGQICYLCILDLWTEAFLCLLSPH